LCQCNSSPSSDFNLASKTATPAPPSESESDSDEGYQGPRRQVPTKKQRRHQLKVAAGLAPPSQSHTRFSGRSRATANYNEDQGEDEFEESLSDTMTPNYAAVVENNYPTIDLVLDHRFPEGVTFDKEDLGKRDFEYLVKWTGQAHYHATWETYESLKGFRVQKMDNYFRKFVESDIYFNTAPDVVPEDKEKWILDRERGTDALEEYRQIERIIGSQRGDEEDEYLVKWKGLTYDYCTWEPQSLVSKLDMDQIDKFLTRSQNLPYSDRLPNGRGEYRAFKEQHSYIKHGQLRDFQIVGVNFLARNWCLSKNVMLADEMGLGKTVQTIAFMNWLRHEKKQQGPFLIVVPLSTVPAWQETFDNWTPDINYVVYNGNQTARDIIRDQEMLVSGDPRRTKFHALLTTYEYIGKDFAFLSQIKWQFMAVDEAHRLKNQNSQLHGQLTAMKAGCRLLITGTPMQNNLGELRALMDFLMPGEFQIDEDLDLTSGVAAEEIAQLTAAIRPFMIRRTKNMVEKDLPPKTEKIMRVELSDVQLEIYRQILTRNYDELNKGASKGQKQSLLNIMMELKKASNHPYMFPNVEDRQLNGSEEKNDQLRHMITSSGKMMVLEKLLDKLKKDGHRVLIFSQMVRMLDILSDYLTLRKYNHQRLDGTMPSSARRHAIDHFNAEGSDDFVFILSTRAGGLGINLMTADTVILFDSDWNPQADLQAMARAHRIGQKNAVTVYRLVSKDTVEEEVLERARNKLFLEYLTIQRGVTESDLKEKLAKTGVNLGEPASADDISRILKSRSQKMFHDKQNDNQKKLESLDIDAMLNEAELHETEQPEGITADGGEEFLRSFEYTDVKVDLEWDEIIPKEQLEAIRAEDEKKKHEAFIAQVAAEESSRRRKQTASDEREQRAAKKKAREAAKAAAADGEQSDDSQDDPRRPLTETEIRRLWNAYLQYGGFDDMQKDIVTKARLTNRDPAVLRQVLDDMVAESKKALKEDTDRVAELEKKQGKSLTRKDKKEVMFDFRGLKRVNAKTILERPSEMRMLRDIISKEPDVTRFRIPEAVKPAKDFTCEWGSREDGMLMVGIERYGWGPWASIRDDPQLNMKDKCFLEEQRREQKEARQKGGDNAKQNKPTQVHLNRRANYLINVLKDKLSNGADPAARKAMENHHRNVKKLAAQQALNGGPVRNRQRTSEKTRNRGNSHSEARRPGTSQRDRTGTPDIRRKITDEDRKLKRRKDEEGDRDHKRHKFANGDRDIKRRRSDDMNGSPAARRGDSYRDEERHKSSSRRDDRSPDDRKSHHNRPDSNRIEPQRLHSGSKTTEIPTRTDKPKVKTEKPKVERDSESDRVCSKLLEPVTEHIRLIPKLAGDKQADPAAKKAKIQTALLTIGAFILKQPTQDAERNKLWEYFGHKCFRGLSAEKMVGIYNSYKAKEAESLATANGHTNGEEKIKQQVKPQAVST
jgi:chromodomain-helicase-DNA-binding protein 1